MKNSSIMYGPSFSYRISDSWTMSMLFMFCVHGQYRATSQYFAQKDPFTTILVRVKLNQINKYDFDWTFNYRLSKIVKFFFGAKGQGYTYDGRFTTIARFPPVTIGPLSPMLIPLKGTFDSYLYTAGPGTGFSFTFGLAKNFFLIWNISGILMAGKAISHKGIGGAGQSVFINYGGNTNLSFAYYFEKEKLTVVLGGRYQMILFEQLSYRGFDGNPDRGPSRFDQFYGVTFSLTAAF